MLKALMYQEPFPHYIGLDLLTETEIRAINAEWPKASDPRWYIERAGYVRKAALMFPARLPETAQRLAETLYGSEMRAAISSLMGYEVMPDPWFTEGPIAPRVGGGLHEIGRGGMLGIHLDFDKHPTGLTRAVNLLIYLNEDWQDEWGGELELHGETVVKIPPRAGTAVMFETNNISWHGHPHPLTCPPERARRSLALYYYREPVAPQERQSTVYRRR